ncbi:MAG: hypothetical protein HC905_00005, partial [Bacteroidales bacterium]|nr:hypothetical protein [Bacteroidales bacterium]
MYSLYEVKTEKDVKDFLLLPVKLYKNEKKWVRPLDKDILGVFDPSKNKLLRHGACIRWLLRDNTSEVVGRVAAFVDHKGLKKEEIQAGGMGFFECINNQDAAFKLFDACKDWLQQKGLEAMDGPVNFGDRDRWVG